MALINIESDNPETVKTVRKFCLAFAFLSATTGAMSVGGTYIGISQADKVTNDDGQSCYHFTNEEQKTNSQICSNAFAEKAIPVLSVLGFLAAMGGARASSRRLSEIKEQDNNGQPPPPKM